MVEFVVDITVVENVSEVVDVDGASVSIESLLISVDVTCIPFESLNKFCIVSISLSISLSIGVAWSIPVQHITKKTHLKVTAIVISKVTMMLSQE